MAAWPAAVPAPVTLTLSVLFQSSHETWKQIPWFSSVAQGGLEVCHLNQKKNAELEVFCSLTGKQN